MNLLKTFYHSLKSKPFVILSGLSGTGKTKLFENFTELFSGGQKVQKWVVEELDEHERMVVPVYKEQIELNDKVLTIDNFVQKLNEIKALRNEGRVKLYCLKLGRFYLKPRTSSEKGDYEDIYKTVVKASKFGYCAISCEEAEREGLIRIVGTLKIKEIPLSANKLFIPIRPDFRDSKSLLGFYNPIQQKYQKTKLLDFILSAAKDYLLNGKDAVPYFILFDEMNLARVEYYFADFLSLLESKRFSSVEEALGDNEFKEFLEALGFEPSNLEEDRCAFTSASIPLHSEDGLREPPKNLFLPPNLYFIGTVNVDETTHVFSPKVLDRAFTIEFDVGSFKDYVEEFLEGRGGNVFCLPPKGKFQEEKLREDFIRKDAKTTIAKFTIYEPNDFKDIATKIKFKKKFQSNQSKELYKFLDELNGILKRYGFPFGYRVFNEILIFIKNATEGLKGLRLSYNEALDRVLLMKVLPKLYGTRKKLAPLIEELLKEIFAVKGVDVNRVETLPTIEGGKVKVRVGGEEKEVESPYPLTVKKLLEMAYKLSTDGYASYM